MVLQFEIFKSETESLSGQIAIEDVFEAYYDCRRTKRRTVNALSFELNYEQELIRLCEEINDNTYKIGRSIAFIVKYPVQREIFAADFRDRIVHHLVISKINDLLEKEFMPNSYSCRKGKGVLYGVRSIQSQIEDCVAKYGQSCHILKLDIRSFFMSIDKNVLYLMLVNFLNEKYHNPDKHIVLRLVKQIIFNSPNENCVIKGKKSDWNGLPKHKSLFNSGKYKGLPIGNLTSQIFANFYLDKLDKYVTEELGIEHYGRYVDDFVLMHPSKEYLLYAHKKIRDFLKSYLKLDLHPNKFYLQHYSKGLKFIGAVIKPECVYIGSRSKGNLYNKIYKLLPQMAQSVKSTLEKLPYLSSCVNSYLGFMRHYNTYNLRSRVLKLLDSSFLGEVMELAPHAKKLCLNKLFSPHKQKQQQLRRQRQYRRYAQKKQQKGENNGSV